MSAIEPAAAAPRAPGMPTGRLPDFFIVGHAKSGTTSLYEMLRGHPQIFMPDSKEPWFFASELHERTPPRPGGTPQTLAQYRALFAAPHAHQRVGEASALYLWSRTAAARIAAVAPAAKVIAILREPASFLRSLHLQFVQAYVEDEPDFRRALALEDDRRAGRHSSRHTYWPQAVLYSDHVRYAEQLGRYRKHFGAEQMLVLIYDDLRANNDAEVRRVLGFLGVDDTVAIAPREANPSVQVRSRRVHEFVHAVSVGHGPASLRAKGAVKTVVPRRVRRAALHATQRHVVFTEPQAADEELMAALRRRFAGEVHAVSEYLGRDLVGLWGYDRLH